MQIGAVAAEEDRVSSSPLTLTAVKSAAAIISLDPTGRGRQRWSNRWKEALNAFEITFNGRLSTNRK
jgi:hypothetical protein